MSSDKNRHCGEARHEAWGEALAEDEVGEGKNEGEAHDATEDAMAPFPEEYAFEVREGYGGVEPKMV